MPKISVIMPVYNGENYLNECIDSILNQTFDDFELIIINDASTDSTWKIINEYAQKDQRIRLCKNQENLGLIKSLNKGLNLAQGEYIARQDADDLSMLDRFQKQVEILDKYSNVILVSCDIETIDSHGNSKGFLQRACDSSLVNWYLLFYNHIAGHSQVMFRRKPVLDMGGYSHQNHYSEDYELWSRLSRVGDIHILPEVLLKQRFHDASLCAKRGKDQKLWSLTQSKKNIEQLTGQEISLQNIENLRNFWLFRNPIQFHFLQIELKTIYQAFISQEKTKHLKNTIRKLIAEQMTFALRQISVRKNINRR